MFASVIVLFALQAAQAVPTSAPVANVPRAAAKAPAQDADTHPNPVATFLQAADKNDFSSMQAVMAKNALLPSAKKIPATEFIKRINGCYLRRVYKNGDDGRVIAGWMCSEGAAKSRVLLGDVAMTEDKKVIVLVVREDRNNRPAPERKGSAFADE